MRKKTVKKTLSIVITAAMVGTTYVPVAAEDTQGNQMSTTVEESVDQSTDQNKENVDEKSIAEEGKDDATGTADAAKQENDSQDKVTTSVAKIGDKEYATLAEAIAAVPANGMEPTTITLTADAEGGVKIGSEIKNQNIIINLNGHSYNVKKGVGSTGTETNGMQLILGSTVVIENGTLQTEAGTDINFLIKNYSDLTLDNVVLDAKNVNKGRYNINNCGKLTVNGENTKINAPTNGYAITTGNYVSGVKTHTIINAGTIESVYTEGSFWNADEKMIKKIVQ